MDLTGRRVRLTYFDQNEAFGRTLQPDGVTGTIARRLALKEWGDDWYVLDLDAPLEYGGHDHERVLVRSRWDGHHIGEREPTSVFVLLIPDPMALDDPLPSPDEFEHVAWGMVSAS